MKKQILEWPRGQAVQSYDMDGNHQDFVLDKSEEVYNVFGTSFVNAHLSHLMGEVLTVIDATIDEERKLKATKDLIRDKFSSKMDWLYEQANYPVGMEPHFEDD